MIKKLHCRSYAKGFGAMGALFAGSECVIEKTRAKHDMYNSIYAGEIPRLPYHFFLTS